MTKYELMSITKSVIGILYEVHKDRFPRDSILFDNVTVGDALNMKTGYIELDAETNPKSVKTQWDYWDFDKQKKRNGSLKEYAIKKLKTGKRTDKMCYSNLTYQILASHFPDLPERFGDFIGCNEGWEWERGASHEPIGPHGIWMSDEVAIKFAEKSRYFLNNASDLVDVPVDQMLLHNKNGTFRKYWNGWWFSKKCRYCIGFVVQVICVAPNGVMTQLYEEEWKGDPFDKPEQMFNFIQNIENFYNNYQCDIDKYLEVAMGPRSTHKYGRSIIAPSGSGKSTYIMNQQSPNAILDCDPMTWACNAQPHAGNKCPWDWNKDMRIICIQVDAAVQYCKQKRLWIMGATWWDPSIIDVVVILDEDLHRQYFLAKEDPFPPSYFEATIKKKVIPQLRKDAKEYNIPIYESLKDAEFYIRSLEQPLSF